MKIKDFLPGINDSMWCPVCGFSCNSFGGFGHGCAFGHLWEIEEIKKSIPKKSRRTDCGDA